MLILDYTKAIDRKYWNNC